MNPRRLSPWLKAALGALGLLAALLVASPLLIRLFLPPERLRELVVKGAEKGLHRRVKLGSVSLGVLTGLTLKDAAVSEAPDFAAGTFAETKSFSVRVKLLPLLEKKVIVDKVSASGLKVRVVKRKDGSYSFSDLLAGGDTRPAAAAASAARPAGAAAAPAAGAPKGAAPAATPASGGAPMEVDIRSLALDGAELSYEEEGGARSMTLSGVDARISGFSLAGPFYAQLAARAKGVWDGRPIEARASYSGKLDLGGKDPRKFAADAKSLEFEAAGWTLKGSGTIKDLGKPSVDAALSLAGPKGASAEGTFKGQVTLPAEEETLAVAGTLTLKTAALKADDAAALGLPAGMPVPKLSLSSDFAYADDSLTLKRLDLQSPFGPLKASGTAGALSGGKPDLDLDVDADLDLPALSAAQEPWLKLPAGAALPPLKIAGKAHVKGDALTTPGLSARGAFGSLELSGAALKLKSGHPDLDLGVSLKVDMPALRDSDLKWANLPAGFSVPAMAVEGKGRFKGDDLALTALKVKGKAGTLVAAGAVRGVTSASPEPNLDLTMNLALPALKSADDPFGKVPPGLSLPASTWDGALSYSRDEVKIRTLRVVVGSNDLSIDDGRVTGMRGGAPYLNLVVKCRKFDLAEITAVTQTMKELDLSGSGYFALGATGRLPRPVLEGKAQFKGIGATVEGLKLAGFTGTATFNETLIDIPNLRGKLADGDLDLNLTVRNYASAPNIDLEATLSRFDLGAWLAAKTALAAKAQAKAAAKETKASAAAGAGGASPAGGATAAAGKPSPPISARGKLSVGQLVHPNAEASDIKLSWDITGLTPELRQLNGSAGVSSPSGRFTNLNALGKQSKILKIITFPLAIIQKIALGAMRIDLNNPRYTDFTGDYAFQSGVMTVRDSRVVAEGRAIDIKGDIDLPKEELNLTVVADVGTPLEIGVTGTLDEPKAKPKLAKLLAEPLKQGAQKLLENLFKH